MKATLAILLIAFCLISTAFADDEMTEQGVRRFLAEYKAGVGRRDITFLENTLSDEYVFSGPSGEMTTRAQALEYFRRQRSHPDYKSISLEHLNEKIHLAGTMAIVTNDWISTTAPVDPSDAETTTYKGRHTGVLERRDGHWLVIAEHDTMEPTFNDKLMVSGVMKAEAEYNKVFQRLNSGLSYAELESSGVIAALDRLLAVECTFTSTDGLIFDKTADMERYRSGAIVIETQTRSEQNVRTIDNASAIATGMVRTIGTNAGKPFDITERYTTTWAFYDERWQITASHTSAVAQSSLKR